MSLYTNWQKRIMTLETKVNELEAQAGVSGPAVPGTPTYTPPTIIKKSWIMGVKITGSDDAPAIMTLPAGVTYKPGKNQIMQFVYNGSVCAVDINYKENTNNSLLLLFETEPNDVFEITIISFEENE